MKTYFAQLLSLLPSITQGDHVNLRGASLQDEPESIRQLDGGIYPYGDCIPPDAAIGWYGPTAQRNFGIKCWGNHDCKTPGDKCLVAQWGVKFYCGNPVVYDQSMPMC